jgi:hypothetical protein
MGKGCKWEVWGRGGEKRESRKEAGFKNASMTFPYEETHPIQTTILATDDAAVLTTHNYPAYES